MKELTAFCPQCDGMIENLPNDLKIGDAISCDNFPCMNEMIVEEIEKDGNVWFEEYIDED